MSTSSEAIELRTLNTPLPAEPVASLESIASLEDVTNAEQYAPLNRVLPSLATGESLPYRLTWLGVLAVFVGLFSFMTFTFWAPAHPGVDQNGYLVGGRQFSKTLSTKFVPANPYEYVGNMWVMVGDQPGTYYPKYPLGLPVLYAIMLWIGGAAHGHVWAFLISPVSMVLAVVGMFFLARAVAGSFAAMLAAILLATSQVTLVLANNPNSHSSCLAFVVWGMFFTLRWWQTNSIWRGLLGGFFLGYACTIRYTEGLLLLPLALAIICSIRWTVFRSYLRAAVPALGWLLPVGSLLIFNRIAIGSWTGYDTTNESGLKDGSFWHNYWHAAFDGAAFTWAKFALTWEQVVRTLNDQGLFFVLPLGIVGVAMVFRRSWQFGLLLLCWLIPGIALYTSYYWSPDRGVSYARFFVTFFPGFLVGVAVCIRYGIVGSDDFGRARRSIAAPIAAGLVVAAASGIGLYRAAGGMEDGQRLPMVSLGGMHRLYSSLAVSGDIMHKNIPDGSIVFADGPRMAEGMMNYGQFMGDWEMYATTAFTPSAMRAFLAKKNTDPNDPNPLQPRRREYLFDLYNKKTEADLLQEQQRIVQGGLEKGRHVFLIGTKASVATFEQRFFPSDKYDTRLVARWNDQIEPIGKNDDPNKPEEQPRGKNGFAGGGRAQRAGPGANAGPRGGFADWTMSSWQLIEVALKNPTTKPAAN
ncbi:hypothetical protein BH10PLA1_BH10PLA1_22040 [soil metagenome]